MQLLTAGKLKKWKTQNFLRTVQIDQFQQQTLDAYRVHASVMAAHHLNFSHNPKS